MSGRCIAGKEILQGGNLGEWIRPVSAREHEEVSMLERRYQDGSDPSVLDIIDVPVLDPRPKNHQRENWLIDPNRDWVKIDQVHRNKLPLYTDSAETLWTNGYSSGKGQNDRIPISDAQKLITSLCLIKVSDLWVSVSVPYNDTASTPELRGHFRYNDCDYSLRITDPNAERLAKDLGYGDYEVGKRFLTVSLADPFDGHFYKLIAAIIKP